MTHNYFIHYKTLWGTTLYLCRPQTCSVAVSAVFDIYTHDSASTVLQKAPFTAERTACIIVCHFQMQTTKRHFQRQTYPIFSATETALSPFARESKNYTWNTDTGTSVTQKHAGAHNATTSHILAELHLIEFMASCLREPTWERMPPKPTKAS